MKSEEDSASSFTRTFGISIAFRLSNCITLVVSVRILCVSSVCFECLCFECVFRVCVSSV